MRLRTAIVCASLSVVIVAITVAVVLVKKQHPQQPLPRAGFYVNGGRLYDANNKDFIMRGVGHAHTVHPGRTASTIASVKSLGANTVRLEISTGAVWDKNGVADITNLISLCRKSHLICVLVAHDTTGWGHRPRAIPQAQAVDYWINIKSALAGQEKYVVINVANEPYVLDNYQKWPADTIDSVNRLRKAGLHHTLMVDAPDWGQDRSFTMRDNAAAVFNSDPDRNTVFSIHMYGAFDRAARVADYLKRYVNAKLPIVISEFGYMHSDGEVDEEAIMAEAQVHGLGYLGWSWSGNGGDVPYLDMVTDFDAGMLTPWGKRIFNGANGIRQTSREASVFAT
jgi:mannan endo-1,4-beta-mannosidase